MAETYNFKNTTKGNTNDGVTFTLQDSGGNPIDLTGATISSKFRKGSQTGKEQVEFTIGNGITVDDAVNGIFSIDDFISDWNPDRYYYDIKIVFADSTVKTYIKGELLVEQNVT